MEEPIYDFCTFCFSQNSIPNLMFLFSMKIYSHKWNKYTCWENATLILISNF